MQNTTNIVTLQQPRDVATREMHSSLYSAEAIKDNRCEGRSIAGDRLFVQITQAADKEFVGKTISCTAVDSSAHGIKFLTEEEVPPGCLMDLWVDNQARPGKFFLSGDARWTQKAGAVSTLVGVRLQEGTATDIDSWKTLHTA